MLLPARSRAILVLIGCISLIAGRATPSVAAKTDACRAACQAEKQACRNAFKSAFQSSKADCTGSGRAKRQCVKTARSVLRSAVKTCRGFAATCVDCCKAGGTDCDVQCGDGVVAGAEACDPPRSNGCAGEGACNDGCRCPSTVTTTSAPPTTTTHTTTSTTSTTTTTTQPSPCANGIKDGNETATDCGGGTCAPCVNGLACTTGGDCQSRFCSSEICTDPCPTQPAGTPCADDGNACTIDTCDGSTCQNAPADAGTICRPAAGVCDVAEECDGSGAQCPVDQLAPTGELCRSLDGGCDEEERCTGSSPECPADAFTRAGATCRVSRGVCDRAETCSGTSGQCPADGFLGSETVCRTAAGVCDLAETCSGSSKDCPDDGFQLGNVCRQSAGECDVAETCSGDADCPPDAHSAEMCRPSKGTCDPAEFCGPASVTCPDDKKRAAGSTCLIGFPDTCQADTFCDGVSNSCPNPQNTPKAPGAVCRAPVGPCDAPEVCDGLTTICPADAFEPDTKVCRPAQGLCDVDDYCTGFSPICTSPDDKKPLFTVCREKTLNPDGQPFPCDKEEKCDGVNNECPADGVQSKYFVCRPPQPGPGGGTAGQACDAPEFCDGEHKFCGEDLNRPPGTVCSPETECRETAYCVGRCGGTIAGAPCGNPEVHQPCPADSPCMPFGPFEILACGSQPRNEGLACADGMGTCVAGACAAGPRKFGEKCDGHDYYINGDPDRLYCGDDPDHQFDLKCCAGSRMAMTGQSGTCRECCNSDLNEYNGGCPQNEIGSRECCSGVCKDTASDPNNCGSCGNDCFKNICPSGECFFECLQGGYIKDGACPQNSYCPVSCGYTSSSGIITPGVCLYESACSGGKVCSPSVSAEDAHPNQTDCEQYRNCANYPVPAGGTCIPRTVCTVSFGGECKVVSTYPLDIDCPYLAKPVTCVTPETPGHCGSCRSDDDCYAPDICQSSCGGSVSSGPFAGLCDEPGYCARVAGECF